MSKVLISFLGTGGIDDNRRYRTAEYRFSDGTTYTSSFIADALADYYDINKIILIGTVKSMWEEVYCKFCQKRGIPIDDDYSTELGVHCDEATHASELSLPHKEKIEEALGVGSHVALINYGLDKTEIDNNAAVILGLEEYISNNDELFVDITHSFRSLPLYLMNLLIYLKDVSRKNINISHISYGMLDVSRELGYTPVVELNGIMDIHNWITGAFALSQFGNGYQIADLLSQEDRDSATRIRNFSDEMNLNHLAGIRNQAQVLSGLRNKHYSPIPERIVPQTINNFTANFQTDSCKSKFLFNVANWQFIHKNYSSSYISLLESILTYICEKIGFPSETTADMEIPKAILGKRYAAGKAPITDGDIKMFKDNISVFQTLKDNYDKIHQIRNGLAHQSTIQLEVRNQKTHQKEKVDVNSKKMIDILSDALDQLRPVLNNQ